MAVAVAVDVLGDLVAVQDLMIALVWFHAIGCGVVCRIYRRSTWTSTLMIRD